MTVTFTQWRHQVRGTTKVVWVNTVWGFRLGRTLTKNHGWKRIIRLEVVA